MTHFVRVRLGESTHPDPQVQEHLGQVYRQFEGQDVTTYDADLQAALTRARQAVCGALTRGGFTGGHMRIRLQDVTLQVSHAEGEAGLVPGVFFTGGELPSTVPAADACPPDPHEPGGEQSTCAVCGYQGPMKGVTAQQSRRGHQGADVDVSICPRCGHAES